MSITPDAVVYWQWGMVKLNATIVYTWVIMALLVIVSWLGTRGLTTRPKASRWQNLVEMVIVAIQDQIRDISGQNPAAYLAFIGTLFLFILISAILTIVPGFLTPIGSLSTTAALAICVFLAVPLYGVTRRGLRGYLATYASPSVLMLPFNVIGEFSRTLALAVRLYGNIMSGTMIVGVLISVIPLFFPVIMQVLGLVTGVIQAYIFAVLAMVYIGSATRIEEEQGRLDAPAEQAAEPSNVEGDTR